MSYDYARKLFALILNPRGNTLYERAREAFPFPLAFPNAF
jgi:hypothetical protein